MPNKPHMGDNRTGIARARERTLEMLNGSAEFTPPPVVRAEPFVELRASLSSDVEPIGSVPPPASVKQVGKSVVSALKGGSPTLFVDKIGARLAFERQGVRLYEALLAKMEAFGTFDGGPSRADLESILADEQRHFAQLADALISLGADPTAMTPAADIEATLSMGVQAVMVDARTDFPQSLEAALIAELADNDGWEALIDLTRKAGQKELGGIFELAAADEQRHLSLVRRWLAAYREAA